MSHTGRRTPSTEGLRLVAPALILVTVVTGTALGAVLATSLGLMPLVGEPRLSLDAFTSLSNDLGAATGESLLTAATATLIAAAVGLAIASTCLHVRLARRAVIGLAVVVVTVPHLIGAAATALLLSDVGLAQRWTGVATSSWPELVGGRWPWATVLELAWKESAFVALVIVAAVGRRYRELAEIASVLGATPRQRWRRVLVPLAGPALTSASLIVFVYSLGTYEVARLLGRAYPEPLPVLAYRLFTDVDIAARPQAAAAAVVVTALGVVAAVAVLPVVRRLDTDG